MKQIVGYLRDAGCLQNILPPLLDLKQRGFSVAAFLEPGEKAAENFDGSVPTIDTIPEDAIVLACLPLGDLKENHERYETISNQGNLVVNLQENPDWHDYRFPAIVRLPRVTICALSRDSTNRDPRTEVTGLPAIDAAAAEVAQIDRQEVLDRITSATGNERLVTAKHVIAASLPGDLKGCLRMLARLKPLLSRDIALVARSHPKLPAENLKMVDLAVQELGAPSLAWTNDNNKMTMFDLYALAVDGNFFAGTHDSTTCWQAAGAEVDILVLPPDTKYDPGWKGKDEEQWAEEAPIITSGVGGVPLFANMTDLPPSRRTTTLMTGNAVGSIADVVLRHAHA